MSPLPWSRTASGLRLTVRLIPCGGRDALGGLRHGEAGRVQLLARVTSPPVEGGANASLVRLAAKTLHVPKSAVTIVSGKSAGIKTLDIAGDLAALERVLKALI